MTEIFYFLKILKMKFLRFSVKFLTRTSFFNFFRNLSYIFKKSLLNEIFLIEHMTSVIIYLQLENRGRFSIEIKPEKWLTKIKFPNYTRNLDR